MIIGPNGTGKSTVVCAICLGLGGKPEILGRAKSPRDFIRQGCERAIITIELQGRPKQPNIKIRRTIDGDNSSWQINGRSSTLKEVKRITDDFNIMMDNLCQFLPQDKVSKFAELPATDLLIETERAVGSPNLVQYHERLIELDEKQSALGTDLGGKEQRLSELKARQAEEEENISRMKERQKYQERYELLAKTKPFLEYRDMIEAKRALDEEGNEAKEKLEQVKQNRAKFELLSEQAAEKCKEVKRETREVKGNMATAASQLEEAKEGAQKAVEELQKDKLRLKDIANRQKSDQAARQDLVSTIKKIEILQKDNSPPDPQEIVRVRELQRQNREQVQEAQESLEDPSQELAGLADKTRSLQMNMKACRDKLDRLKSVLNQKLEYLHQKEGKLGADTARASEFILQNKNLFEHEVHLPPVLSIKFKDRRCIPQISANLSRNVMFTFTCESRKDYQTFTRVIIDEHNWNVNVAEFAATGLLQVANHKAPCDREMLPRLGLDGFLLDLLEGPEPVLNMLCHKSAVHAMPYSSEIIQRQQKEQLIEAKDHRGEPLFHRFADSKTLGSIVKSRYGARLVSCRESMLGPPPGYIQASQGSSDDAIKSIKAKIVEIENFLSQHQEAEKMANEKYRELEQVVVDLKEEGLRLKEQTLKLKTAEQLAAKYASRHALCKKKLEELDSNEKNYGVAKSRVEEDISLHFKGVQEAGDKLIKRVKVLVDLQKEYQKGMMNIMTYENEMAVYSNMGGDGVRKAEERVASLANELYKLKEEMHTKKHEVKALRAKCTDEEKEQIEQMYKDAEYSLDHLSQEIAQVKAMLDVSRTGGEEAAMTRFNKRAQEIEVLETSVSDQSAVREQYMAEIAEVRQMWEPEVVSIVERISREFSTAFKLIKCQGQVQLGNTDKGFKDWSMDIMVSFRDNAELQILNHQRQSGGERSVSTIFYLISLQGLTKSPFRVVDEINQGMDQKNERIVHSRMVNIACRDENSSQYFLITPKLLTDLEYHEKIKVHTIYSGKFVKDTRELTFSPCYLKNLVKIARQLREEEALG